VSSESWNKGARIRLNGQSIPVAMNEEQRLRILRSYSLLDTESEDFYNQITAVAAAELGMPVAVISLVDRERIWFKSAVGVEITEIPRDPTFCSSAILSDDVYEVEDTRLIATTCELVTGVMGVRFYAGAPLIDSNGFRLGTLCVLDQQPNKLTSAQRERLSELASLVMDGIHMRSVRH